MKGTVMAHALEIGANGEVAFASLREPAWHNLGTVFENEVSTSEMLDLAHLSNWNVRLADIDLPARSHRNWFGVVRTNPFDGEDDVLGVVGQRYVVMQNEQLFEFGDALLDGGRWETAGSIKNGTVVFGSLALDRETVLDPSGVSDRIDNYLLVHTSHDGSVAIQASVTPVRVVCQNTLGMALHGVKQSYKIRHTQTAEGKVQAAREALGLAKKYLDEFDVLAHNLIQTTITDQQFFDLITAVYPKPEQDASKGSKTKWENKVDTINSIYTGPTNYMIAGTAWGALNAMTERLDWYRTGRNGSNDSVMAAASGFDVATNSEKARILSAVKSLVAA
jgi:phage/plasmid-like protein (TIGR03299 family)